MAIHHDKALYGKLQSLREDVSEELLLAMANRLNSDEEKEEEKNANEDKEEQSQKQKGENAEIKENI